jgi:hypothetical protein
MLGAPERGIFSAMPGVVIGGHQIAVPGLDVRNWFDDGALRLKAGEDFRRRDTDWVRGICLHTTKGWPDRDHPRPMHVLPGLGQGGRDDATVRYWATSSRQAGAHLVVDDDGSVVCCADLALEAAYHAGKVNEVTIGIEIYQGSDAELYAGQLDATVRLVDFLTRQFGIQRQFQRRYLGKPVPRIAPGAQDVVGVYGHRDVTTNRGAGDPGDFVFAWLAKAGYEAFSFEADEDKAVWRERQRTLGLTGEAASGIPGSETVRALAQAGHAHGLWVRRPGDEPLDTPVA